MDNMPIKIAGNRPGLLLCLFFTTGILITSCTPTIRVVTPSEPITINLNVKIEHEIRIRVDKELDDLFKTEDDLF